MSAMQMLQLKERICDSAQTMLNRIEDLENQLDWQRRENARKRNLYLILLHGRPTPEAETDPTGERGGWGTDGPIFEIEWIHFTYMSTIRICPAGECEDGCELQFHEDLLHYDGVFYGDWTVTSYGDLARDPNNLKRIQPFEEAKAALPTNAKG